MATCSANNWHWCGWSWRWCSGRGCSWCRDWSSIVGALGRPVGVESGAGIGAAIGAAVGGAGGGGSATAVAGYIRFNCIKDYEKLFRTD